MMLMTHSTFYDGANFRSDDSSTTSSNRNQSMDDNNVPLAGGINLTSESDNISEEKISNIGDYIEVSWTTDVARYSKVVSETNEYGRHVINYDEADSETAIMKNGTWRLVNTA